MGVSNRTLLRRLRAWSVGGPIARGTTIHTSISTVENRFLLAFIRMGGESRPWGVAWKASKKPIKFRAVGEPRAREFVDDMLVELSEDLAAHIGHPYYYEVEKPERRSGFDRLELPQIWVPNSTHIDMLHFLAYSYIRRRGDEEQDVSLRMLGRIALHLFLETRRPGQQLVINASSALQSAYDFPCEDARQAHLGLLIAWLDNRGDRDHGLKAALEAEQLSVSTSLDPALERDVLSDLVDKYNASRTNRGRGDKTIEKKIETVISKELRHRIGLVEQAVTILEEDERDPNGGLVELAFATADQLFYGHLNPEHRALEAGKEPFAVSPETDWDARSASERFYRNAAAQDRERNALIHFDRELEAEAINDGSAFRGTITSVTDEGTGRVTTPVWEVVDPVPGALSLRQWDKVCIVGAAGRKGIIRDIRSGTDASLEIEVEITDQKTEKSGAEWPHRMAGADPSWLGLSITLISDSFASLTDKKAFLARDRDPAPADWMIDRLSRQPRTEEDES